jgi:hypothetical protein
MYDADQMNSTCNAWNTYVSSSSLEQDDSGV